MFNPNAITPIAGQTVVWSRNITNNGANTAQNVVVDLSFSNGLGYNNSTVTKGYYDHNNKAWYIGQLAKDEVVTINIIFNVLSVPTQNQTVTAIVSGIQNDTNLSNNTITDTLMLLSDNEAPCPESTTTAPIKGNLTSEKCIGCTTEYEVISSTNAIPINFNSTTGYYEVVYQDITLPITINYRIRCSNCNNSEDSYSCNATHTIVPLVGSMSSSTTLQMKVMLGYNSNDISFDRMHNILQQNEYLPLVSPFTGQVDDTDVNWNTSNYVDDGDKSVVDWIFVWLENESGDIIQTRSGLILSDGSVVGLSNGQPLRFTAQFGAYKIAFRVRNSLRARTTSTFAFTGGIINLDTTNGVHQFDGGLEYSYGYYRMILGDLNNDNVIESAVGSGDRNILQLENGSEGYFISDLNRDSFVDSADVFILNANNGKTS